MADPAADLRDPLHRLASGHALSADQARLAFHHVVTGHATDAQIAALLTALALRPTGPTVEEITGAALALREHLTPVVVPTGLPALVDTCGTGGDHARTFNISTAAALIAAGAGAHVAKHGNRSVTSSSGSSQVLHALGVNLDAPPEALTRCLQLARICFCFAPSHHPAMSRVAPIRQQLGFRTLFNLLGPLLNPAGASRQLIGVYNPALTETFAAVLRNLGSHHAIIVCGSLSADPAAPHLDEITTTGPTRVTTLHHGQITTQTLAPAELGLPPATVDQLRAASVEESARIVRGILSGDKGPPRDIAVANAAAALVVADLAPTLAAGIEKAQDAIDSGAALAALIQLVQITNA